MKQIRLIFPTPELETVAMALKQEFYAADERTIPGSYKLDNDRISYDMWLHILHDNLSEKTANPKFGISETYFAQSEEGEIVGILNLRHTLTPFYQNSGHIGYSVRPSLRQKGYATAMLYAALEQARAAQLSSVKLVCSSSNVASRKTILRCGGKLARTFSENGTEKEEYIIQL